MQHRSYEEEWMDDLSYEGPPLYQTLRELDNINHLLGGFRVSLKGIEQLLGSTNNTHIKVLDLGCGSGGFFHVLESFLKKKNNTLEAFGWDANPHVTSYAQLQHPSYTFETRDVLTDPFPECDIIHAGLFLHHFREDELRFIIQKMVNASRLGVVINDLHRHPLAYHSIKWLTSLFSRSPMVRFDAPLSVRRGFHRHEWQGVIKGPYRLQWRWAFRWLVVIPPLPR